MSRVRLVQIPLVLGLFAFFLWRTDVGELRHALAGVNPWLAAAVIALNLPMALLFAARSHVVLVRLGHRVRPELLLPVAVLGNVAGALTPASSGEVLRADALRSHAQVAARDGVALVLFERALSLYLMALGTAVAASWVALSAGPALGVTAVAVPLLMLPAAAAGVLRFLPGSPDGGGALPGVLRRIHDVGAQLELLFSDRRLLLAWGAVTAGVFATVTLQYWLLARSLSGVIRPDEAWIAFGASQLAGIASLLPLGLGAADGSLAAVLRRLGMTFEQGAAAAILVRATSTLPLILLALASYLYLVRRAPARPEAALETGLESA